MRNLCLLIASLLPLLAACGGEGEIPPGGVHGDEASTAGAQPLSPEALGAALTKSGIDAVRLGVWRRTPEVTIRAVPVSADEAIEAWSRARRQVKVWGYYPVIVDDTDGEFLGYLEDGEPKPRETLEAAASIDAADWFRAWTKDVREDYGDAELGVWEDGEPQSGYTIPYDYEGEPRSGLRLVLLPTTRPWEAIAWLHFGGWNGCPDPAVHVAVHRHWHQAYGAELVCISRDVVEMRVERPVKNRDAAMKLAREQFPYSGGDLIYQGFGSMRPLATSLIGAESWYFWWD